MIRYSLPIYFDLGYSHLSMCAMIRNLIKSHLMKNRRLILKEIQHINGFMQLLMKQRNTGTKWTKTEKGQLRGYLKRASLYVPVLFVFLLPFGMLLLPILAEIIERRRADRR